ncbi:MAG: DegT/DnrJ/EryC1/StrS aminotransferase family protein [Gemmatimonadetes bacterium]|nr:DegT/DnrJ/EryC1/StrS aminotransferase family protein [Gemmatimonadota bacterium]
MTTGFRFHLPVYSPLTARALADAGRGVVRGADARPALRASLRERYAADEVVLCGSGTGALQLAIGHALALAGGPPVVALPGFGCYDLATAALGSGARIALYDVDPATLAPDLRSLERVLRSGVRTVVAAPLYGIPVDWDALEALLAEHGATAIEDAAQGHGATWRGKPLGALGRMSVLSFGRGKGWCGVHGGALLLRGVPAPAEPSGASPRAEASVLAGGLAQLVLGRPAVYRIPRSLPLGLGETRFRAPSPCAPMTRAAATLASLLEEASDCEAGERAANARFFQERLRFGAGVQPVALPSKGSAGFLRFPLRMVHGIAGFSRSPASLGVAAAYPTTLAALPQVRSRLANQHERLPGSEELARQLVTLPTHSQLTPAERDRLVERVNRPAGATLARPVLSRPA